MKKQIYLLLILFCLFLGAFENLLMINALSFWDKVHMSLGAKLAPIFIFGIPLIGVLYLKTSLKRHDAFSRKFFLFESWLILISFIYSLFYPFESRSLYLLISSPICIYLFFRKICLLNINEKFVIYLFILITVFLSYSYIQTHKVFVDHFSSAYVQIASYYVLLFLPFVLCISNRPIQIICILLVSYVVISSLKRTGSLSLVISVLSYFLVDGYVKDKNISRKILSLAIIFILSYVIYLFVENYSDGTLLTRFSKIQEGGGSGRDEIWALTWNMYLDSNFLQFLTGHGWDRLINDSPLHLSAHNDFLEILYDFGLVGFVLYLLMLKSLLKESLYAIRRHSKYAAPLLSSFIMVVIMSLSSHIVIYIHWWIILVCFWSIAITLSYKK